MSKSACSRILQTEALEARIALTTQLLLDFNTVEAPFRASHFTELKDDTFFVANSGSAQSIEIWKTDGTAEGTSPLTVVESEAGLQLRVTTMVRLAEQLVFLTTESDPPVARLYTSDGTVAGTRHVMELPFFGGVATSPFQVIGDIAYFAADPWHGTQLLMATDGTEQGTRTLGRQKGPSDNFAVTDRGQFFAAGGGTTRYENGQYVQFATQLWFHDDATGTPRLVREFDSGTQDDYADPTDLTAVGNDVFFTAETSLGRELWFSDSTAEGTQLVQDLRVGVASSGVSSLTAVDDELYFLADDGRGTTLWRAKRIDNAFQVTAVGAPFNLASGHLVRDGDTLFMLAQSGEGFDVIAYSTADESVVELGTVEGSSASLQKTMLGPAIILDDGDQRLLTMVRDNSLVEFSNIGFTRFLGVDESTAYLASDGPEGTAIWYTEGTQASTKFVGTIESIGGSTLVGESLVLSAHHEDRHALWKANVDGLAEIATQMPRNGSSTYHSIDVMNDTAIVTVGAGFSTPHYVTWQADTYVAHGAEARKLVEGPFVWGQHGGWPDKPSFHKVGDEYFFAAQTPTDNGGFQEGVWKTDLTPEGTEPSRFEELVSLDPSIEKEPLFGFVSTNRSPPPGADDYVEISGQFWRVEATTHGRYFLTSRSEDDARVDQLFRVVEDGPPELIFETGPLLPRFHSFQFSPVAGHPQMNRRLIALDDVLYFVGSDAEHGVEVWRSDGSPNGTYMLADLNSGTSSSQPRYLGTVDGKIFVNATSAAHGREVWSITADGETRLHQLREGVDSSDVKYMGVAGNSLYVSADDGLHGREVWAIRPDSTLELFDIHPGRAGSNPSFDGYHPRSTASLGDEIYFAADDGSHGRELWVIDGHTVRLERDIRPGAVGSYPVIRAQLSDALLFSANDGVHGRELWSVTAETELLAGDVNGDGEVSMADFLILAANFGKQSEAIRAEGDLDGDEDIDFDDFLTLAANFGQKRDEVAVDAAFAKK